MNHNDHAQGGAAHTVHAVQDSGRVAGTVLRGQAFRLQPAGRGVQHVRQGDEPETRVSERDRHEERERMAQGQSDPVERVEQRHHGLPQGTVGVLPQSPVREASSPFRLKERQHPIVPQYHADTPYERQPVPVVQEAWLGAHPQTRPATLSNREPVQLDGETREPDVLSRAPVRRGHPAENTGREPYRHRLGCQESPHAVHRRENRLSEPATPIGEGR